MKYSVPSLLVAFFLSFSLQGQIYCPDDVTASCFSDLSIEEFGNATVVSGNYHQSQVKYEDDNQTDACNSGVVYRRFYIDVNNNGAYTEGEPSCIQTITLTYEALPLNIQFPSEITLNCLDELPMQSPVWSHYPCDLIGYTYEDEVFDFEGGACQKVVRTFKVINWCSFDPATNQGLYTGIQIIKIVDNEAPEIDRCENVIFGVTDNCETDVVLTNSATDIGDCPSGTLQWTLSVDLWGDGTQDMFFGPNEPQPFRIDEVENGEEISINIPGRHGISNNKLFWTVTDGCGNVRSCNTTFEVIDNKPPTPYCFSFLSATLNGGSDGKLVVPATLFENGGFDNCSSDDEIRLSFSANVEDTEREIQCGEIGFQFYRIFHTDAAGNQDFCEVFLFVLDNGSCGGKFEPVGMITKRNGDAVEGVSTYLMEDDNMIYQSISDVEGDFEFGEQNLMDTYYAKAEKLEDPMIGVDILDYQIMVNAALGKTSLDFYGKVAADMNEDGQFGIDDVELFRAILTGEEELSPEESLKYIPENVDLDPFGAEYNANMSITDYQNGFNFIEVKKGNLTDVVDFAEEKVEVVNLDFVIENDQVVITNPKAIETGFFSIDLMTDKDNLINDIRNVNVYEASASTKIVNLREEGKYLNPSELSLTISMKSQVNSKELLKEVIGDVSMMNTKANGLVDINWNIIDKRSETVNQISGPIELNVYPTLFDDEINVVGNNITNVEMRSVSGQLIKNIYSYDGNRVVINVETSLPTGIYFLKINNNGDEKVVRVVK